MKKIILLISIPFFFVLFITSLFFYYDFKKDDEIIVAVLDTGVDKEHELLKGKVLDGLDLLDYDFDPADPGGHGTHIAGIIINQHPDAKILPVRLLKSEKEELWEMKDVIAVIYAIIRGADVINMSYTTQENIWFNYIIELGVKKGVVFVSSAGNDGEDAISYPASHPDVISVGNTYANKDRLFRDSNYADRIDFVAPGYQIESSDIDNQYSKKTGTSMSSAYVSGVAAYLLHYEKMNHEELKSFLKSKSRQVISIRDDKSFVYHRVDIERMKAYIEQKPYMHVNVAIAKNETDDSIEEIVLTIETENVAQLLFTYKDSVLFELTPNNYEALRIQLEPEQFLPGRNTIKMIGKTTAGEFIQEEKLLLSIR